MKELLEGRRIGFAPRPPLAGVALGLGIGVTISDLMAWFGWGLVTTNGFLAVSEWLAAAAAVAGLLGLLAAVAELRDVPDVDRTLARLDALAALFVTLLYAATAGLRAIEIGAAASSPPAFLLALAGLAVAFAALVLSALLYAAREWEEVEDVLGHRERRSAASR